MNEPAAGFPVPARWIDREAGGVFNAADDPAPDARGYAKTLISVSVPGVLVSTTALLMILYSLLEARGPRNWHEALFVGWWFANVGIWDFLFFQWVQFARGKRLHLAAPGLWRVSALYMLHLISLVVFFFAAGWGWDGPGIFAPGNLAVLSAWLMFPATGFVLTLTLWRRAARP